MRKVEVRQGKPVTKKRAEGVLNTLADAHFNDITLAEAGRSFRADDTDETLDNLTDQSINLVGAGDNFSVVLHVRSLELVRKTAWKVGNVLNRPESDILYPELCHIVESLRDDESFEVDGMRFTVRDRLSLVATLVSDQGKKREIVDGYGELRIAQGLIDPFNKNSDPGTFRSLTRGNVALFRAYLAGEGAVSPAVSEEFRGVKKVCEILSRSGFQWDQFYEVLDLLPTDLSNYEISFLFNEVLPFFYDKNSTLGKGIFEKLEKILQFREFIYFGPTDEELRMFLLDRVGFAGAEFFVNGVRFEASPFIKAGLNSGANGPFFENMIRLFRLELFRRVKRYP